MSKTAAARTILARPDEQKAATSVARALQSKRGKATLSGPDGNSMILPESLYTVLLSAARAIAFGKGITILPVEAVLTTQQAADFLNISRPYLVKQLEEGKLEFHKIGTHRRVKLRDLMAFKKTLAQRREAALQALVDDAQEHDFYEK
jgi:excisionase family DNA binding protein